MKNIYLAALVVMSFLTSCNFNKSEAQVLVKDQEKTLKTVIQNGMILGEFDPVALEAAPFSSWYNRSYNFPNYTPKQIADLKKAFEGVEITGFIGTWCGDTKRDLPQFMRILDEIGFDREKIQLYGMPASYRNTNLAREWKIGNVPTFIFKKDGKEVGRYIERPRVSLVDDILQVLK